MGLLSENYLLFNGPVKGKVISAQWRPNPELVSAGYMMCFSWQKPYMLDKQGFSELGYIRSNFRFGWAVVNSIGV